jgi:hypothetical protein
MESTEKGTPTGVKIVGLLAGVATIASRIFAKWGFGKHFDECRPIKTYQAIVLCVWILLPPVWFGVDYMFFKEGPHGPFDRFKFKQEICSKIWLALVTVLTILYFGKDLGK